MQFLTFPVSKFIKRGKCKSFIQNPTKVTNNVEKFLLVMKLNKRYNVVINQMEIIDMNKKLLWKFNIIDLLIMAIILLGLIALVYRMVAGAGEDERTYTITYICEDAPLGLLYSIADGDLCVDGELGTSLGSVRHINAEINPHNDRRGRATITTTVDGFKAEHGVNIADTIYLKGKILNLIVGDSVFEVYIANIN